MLQRSRNQKLYAFRLFGTKLRYVLVLPLFPQYASSVTASVSAEVFACLDRQGDFPPLQILGAFYDEPDFAGSWATIASPDLEEFEADHVLYSFHGLPERHLRKSDPTGSHCLSCEDCCSGEHPAHATCYRAQCYKTVEAFIAKAGIPEGKYSVAFQSRLGRDPWLKPYTDKVIEELPKQGSSVVVVTHDPGIASRATSRLRLRDGRIAIGDRSI